MKKTWYIYPIIFLVLCIAVFRFKPAQKMTETKTVPQSTPAIIIDQSVAKFYYMLPDEIDFCGEHLVLTEYMKMMLAKTIADEFKNYKPDTVYKLADDNLWFTYINKEPKNSDFPDDLRYIPIIESSLNVEADSKKAVGPLQFTEDTARKYGLRVEPQNNYDERYDFILAIGAAKKYLKKLHNEFKNWSAALAGYNTGENNLQKALNRENIANFDFYRLTTISPETRKFPFRVLAAKIIFTNPKIYDPPLTTIWTNLTRFNEFSITPIKLELINRSTIPRIVEILKEDYPNLDYASFTQYNPQIRGELPPGTYRVYIIENENGTS